MSTAELKLNLIHKITSLTDDVKLYELMQFINFQSDTLVYEMSENEREIISEARTQIANNNVISNETLQKEIHKWLQK